MSNPESLPFSGKVIDLLQQKYIKNRVAWGTAREYSESEPLLFYLRTKGAVKGVPAAIEEAYARYGVIHTPIALTLGTAEFFLTIAGFWRVDNRGKWGLPKKNQLDTK